MGEFQKRIEKEKWGHDWDMGGEGCSITEEDILTLIVEAKKEFPLELMDLAINSNYKKILEWFEKWFGNNGKEST